MARMRRVTRARGHFPNEQLGQSTAHLRSDNGFEIERFPVCLVETDGQYTGARVMLNWRIDVR